MSDLSAATVEAAARAWHEDAETEPGAGDEPWEAVPAELQAIALKRMGAALTAAAQEQEPIRKTDLYALVRDHSIRRVSLSDDEFPQRFGCWACDWTGDSSGHRVHVAEVLRAAGFHRSQPAPRTEHHATCDETGCYAWCTAEGRAHPAPEADDREAEAVYRLSGRANRVEPTLARRSQPAPEADDRPAIVQIADRFVGGDPVNDLAIVLMREWGRVDALSVVARHPASFVATFADLSRAALAWQADHPPVPEADDLEALANVLANHGTGLRDEPGPEVLCDCGWGPEGDWLVQEAFQDLLADGDETAWARVGAEMDRHLADVILAAGFRRSQPAPRTDLCSVCGKYPSHVEHRHPQPAPRTVLDREAFVQEIVRASVYSRVSVEAMLSVVDQNLVPAPRTVTAEEVARAVIDACVVAGWDWSGEPSAGIPSPESEMRPVVLAALASLGIKVGRWTTPNDPEDPRWFRPAPGITVVDRG